MEKYQLENCSLQLPFLCQDSQKTNQDLVEVMRVPTIVIPLDNVTENETESRVGFSGTLVSQTELKSPAFFSGKNSSYIEYSHMDSVATKLGITISMWVKAKNSLIEKRTLMELSYNEASSMMSIFIQNNLLSFKLCEDLQCNNKQIFSSNAALELESWTFIAVTIETGENKGTLFVNNTYGTQDGPGQYFAMKQRDWFKNIPAWNKIKVGAAVLEDSAFQGEISCIQVLNKTLVPSQIYQLSKICHVDKYYTRGKPCPEGYHIMDHHCYKLSSVQLSYIDAMLACTSAPNDPVVTRLAFPDNYQTQENLVVLANKLMNVSQIYAGIDSMTC